MQNETYLSHISHIHLMEATSLKLGRRFICFVVHLSEFATQEHQEKGTLQIRFILTLSNMLEQFYPSSTTGLGVKTSTQMSYSTAT